MKHYRAIRSGSWTSPSDYAQVSVRNRLTPGARFVVLGFRMVRGLR